MGSNTKGSGAGARLIAAIILVLSVLGAGGYFLVTGVIVPGQKYAAAEALYHSGDYAGAEAAFAQLGDYRDASVRASECRDSQGIAWVDSRDYDGLNAHIRLYGLSEVVQAHIRATALEAIGQGDYAAARMLLPALADAPDARDTVMEALYRQGLAHYDRGEYEISDGLFAFLGDYKDSARKIHVHEFALNSETAPSCEEEGAAEYQCHCGASETKPIPATGHDYAEAICTQPAACKVCGHTTGTTLAHTYSAATCTRAKTCSVCGQTDGAALGHSLVHCVCSRCGKVELSLAMLQGTWVHSAGHETIVVSGSTATVYWHTGDKVYSGPVQLRDYGFYIEGTYDDVSIHGEPFTAKIRTTCYISKFTSTYFVDTFDDEGPYTWYKQ